MSLHKTKPKLKKYKKAGLFSKKDTKVERINFFLPEQTYLNLYLKKLEHTFSNSLNNRRRIKLLSGFNQIYKLNTFIKYVEKKTKKNWRSSKANLLATLIERRLDTLLYRVGFASTLSQARQLISHRNVLVNGVAVTSIFFVLSKGDIVSFSPTIKEHIVTNLNRTVERRKNFLSTNDRFEVNLSILKVILITENFKSKTYAQALMLKQDWKALFFK